MKIMERREDTQEIVNTGDEVVGTVGVSFRPVNEVEAAY